MRRRLRLPRAQGSIKWFDTEPWSICALPAFNLSESTSAASGGSLACDEVVAFDLGVRLDRCQCARSGVVCPPSFQFQRAPVAHAAVSIRAAVIAVRQRISGFWLLAVRGSARVCIAQSGRRGRKSTGQVGFEEYVEFVFN